MWPRLRDFWIDQGFALETEEPDIGVMETNWAEEHTPLPAGLLKRMVNALNDALYGVAIRDRFRTRIERGAEPGTTEIYISHKAPSRWSLVARPSMRRGEGLGERVWQPRPNDPGLEAEMLSRMMVFLGADEQRADALVAGDTTLDPRARLVREDGSAVALTLDEGFSRAWRRTSLASIAPGSPSRTAIVRGDCSSCAMPTGETARRARRPEALQTEVLATMTARSRAMTPTSSV